MAKNISLLGAIFTGVTGVTLPQQGGGTVTFPEVSPTTATDSDVASGKIYFKSDGSQSTGTASGGGGVLVVDTTDVHGGTIREITAEDQLTHRDSSDLTASGATVTVPSGYYAAQATKSVQSGQAIPASSISGTGATVSTGTNTITLSKSVANEPAVLPGYISTGTSGNSSVSLTANVTTKGATTYAPSASAQTISSGTYLTGAQTIAAVTTTNLTAANIVSGVTVKVGYSGDDDCVASVTGTASGGGSKNVQIAQSTSRTANTAYTSLISLTCSKTGTYDVYWTCIRTSNASGYTWGSQLYIDGTAYGTAQTGSWSNNVQNIHLSNVTLTKDKTVAVYARSRGSTYYAFVPQLTIIEA